MWAMESVPIATARRLAHLFIAAAALFFAALPAQAEKRVALVIGNSNYAESPLASPEYDARSIAKMLADLGFDVGEPQLNLGFKRLNRALSELNRKAADADIAVVYFAGHGVRVDGTNWLIPVDASLESEYDLEAEAVSVERVVRATEPARSLRLIILDACRNNPFQQPWMSMFHNVGSSGLAPIEDPPGSTLVAYAARPGTSAMSGEAGGNSPYVKALLKYLPEVGIDIERALGRVRNDVLAATFDRQEPSKYGSLRGRQVMLKPGITPEQRGLLTSTAQGKLREGNVELAELLARQALPKDSDAPDHALSESALRVLVNALSADRLRALWVTGAGGVAFSPDVSADRLWALWATGAGGVAFSPDGQRVVTASWDNTARLWDARTGISLAVLEGHKRSVVSAAFSPDGQRVVTASGDSIARLWDARTGASLAVLKGHKFEVKSAAFSPDGQRVVTASWDNTARLWDARTGISLAVLEGHEEAVNSAAFSPDSQRAVTASGDSTARLWDHTK
jgi:hypothetical protein